MCVDACARTCVSVSSVRKKRCGVCEYVGVNVVCIEALVCAECLVGLPVCSVCAAKWVECAFEFGCVAGVVSAHVLHLFAFCMPWLERCMCLRMRYVFVLCMWPGVLSGSRPSVDPGTRVWRVCL